MHDIIYLHQNTQNLREEETRRWWLPLLCRDKHGRHPLHAVFATSNIVTASTFAGTVRSLVVVCLLWPYRVDQPNQNVLYTHTHTRISCTRVPIVYEALRCTGYCRTAVSVVTQPLVLLLYSYDMYRATFQACCRNRTTPAVDTA